MTLFLRSAGRVAIVLALWALSGCGGDSGGPVTPRTLAVTGGDQQSGCLADTLPDSLEVTLTGSDNKPFAGAPVAWQVTGGAATLSRARVATDAAGRSRIQLTLGIALSPVTVSATVTGVSPATFSASGRIAAYTLGQSVSGALTPADCAGSDTPFFDLYAMTLPGPQSFTASLTTAAFDAVLVLGDTLSLFAVNDDSGDGSGGTDSFFRMIASGGLYLIAAQSYSAGETGPYALTTVAAPVAVDHCPFDVFVTRGITTDQDIKATDCVDSSGPFYYDVYEMFLDAGQTMTVTESSSAFDAELFLFVGSTLVGSDDNSAGGTNARVIHQAPVGQNQLVQIVPSTKGTGVTGAYTLTIAPPSAATALAARMLAPQTGRLVDPFGTSKAGAASLREWHRLRQ
jgi:Big-like domain-containing protein